MISCNTYHIARVEKQSKKDAITEFLKCLDQARVQILKSIRPRQTTRVEGLSLEGHILSLIMLWSTVPSLANAGAIICRNTRSIAMPLEFTDEFDLDRVIELPFSWSFNCLYCRWFLMLIIKAIRPATMIPTQLPKTTPFSAWTDV